MLTTKQIDPYWSKGWVVVEGTFDAKEAEAIVALGDRYSAVEQGGGARDRAEDGANLLGKVNRPLARKHIVRIDEGLTMEACDR